MIPPILLMIAAQQRANAARKTILDPKLPNMTRDMWRRNLLAQEKAAKEEAARLADIVLRDLERGTPTADLFALGGALVAPEDDEGQKEL